MPNGEDTKVKLPEDYISRATEQALAQLLEEYEPAEEDIRKRLEAQIQARTPKKSLLASVLAPLAWVFEPVEPVFKTISAAAARPFTMGPGSYFGKQPYPHEIVESYEEWKNPTKFVFDVAPYFLVPSAGQLATGLRTAGTLGKYGATLLEPVVFAEQILGTTISVPFKLAGKIGRNTFFKPTYIPPVGGGAGIAAGDIIPLQTWVEAQAIATKPTAFRRFGQLPGVKQILSHVAPSSIAEDVFDVSVATRNQLLFEAGNRTLLDTAPLRRLGTMEEIWGKVNKENILTTSTFKDRTVQEIQEFPKRYWDKMTPAQREYTTLSQKLEASRTQYLKDNRIVISKTDLEAGQVYAGRTAMVKILADGTTIDIGFVGGKLPGEVTVAGNRVKPRLFRTVEEGMADGYRYFDHFTSLEFRIGASYRRVIDKQWQEYLLNEIPTRTTAVGGAVGTAKREVASRMAALKQLEGIIQRLETQTEINPFQWRGIKSYYEAQYNALRSMAKKPIPKAEAGVTPEVKAGIPGITEAERDIVQTKWVPFAKVGADLGKPLGDIGFGISSKLSVRDLEGMGLVKTRLLSEAEKKARKLAIKDITGKPTEIYEVMPQRAIPEVMPPVAKVKPVEIPKAEAGVAKELLDMKKFIVEEKKALAAFKKEVSAEYAEIKMIVGHRQAIESTSRLFPGRIITAGVAPSGRVVTEQEARAFSDKLAKELNKRFNTPLDMVNKVNDLLRFFQLAGDYSLLGIQLLFFSAAYPHKVPQVMGAMTSALLSPARHANGLIRRAELYARYPNIVISHAGKTEMTRFAGKGGLAESRILTVPRKVLSPFARAFEGGMDEAGGLLLESLDTLGTTAAARADIGDFVNAFRGVHSSARLGVSAEWKAMERASLLAPQYLRASVSLLAMTAQGGLRGKLARRNLAKALMSLTIANITISLARGEEWDEIIEHLNPSSKKFYLWGIGNQMVGPGSKPMAFVRLIASMTDDPGSLWTLSMSNPSLRFVRYSLAPVPGKAIDFLTGENPVGYPTRENALDFMDEIVASSLTPIWLQSLIFEGGTIKERVVRGTGDFWGLRAFLEAGWDRLKRYAKDTYGVDWEELYAYERENIIQSPEGRAFINLMEERSPEFVERIAIRWKYKDQQEVRDTEFRTGKITVSEWIDDYYTAQALRATELKRFDEDFKNMWDSPKSPKERALSDYYTLQQGFVSEESGRFDYESWAIAEARFLTELDPIIREYVELETSASGRTALTQAFRYDKAQLEEYWALTDMIKAQYPSGAAIADELDRLTFEEERKFLTSNREYRLYVAEIERLRKFYRQSSPEIEAILKFWYKPMLVINDNPEAVRLYNEKVAEWRLEE